MLETFEKYFDAIRKFDIDEDTEHTLRPNFQKLKFLIEATKNKSDSPYLMKHCKTLT